MEENRGAAGIDGDGDPHRDTPVLRAGASLGEARAAAILVHGRGATAESILTLAGALGAGEIACFAPQAAGSTWYPLSFLALIDRNEPWLSSALAKVDGVAARIGAGGVGPERLVLLGFSQGACLTLEYSARRPRRYGGIVALSGGLIGPRVDTGRYRAESFEGTPVLLGCSDIDPHIPLERVRETAEVLRRMGAVVDLRIYPGMGHLVNDDELAAARGIVRAAAAPAGGG
jgi:predicted esterase